ncbi:GlxA family transcriptional regulator [Occallatibacter riparius]|uniref:Helix-turn-helix domain-containing protein n=1 Tax=Occallatibacter riparius TaxID=1002689 RepID=A0A9J7BH45_9BACT|nr:helix-turn-helix domain-containing protein [Occallatibacter riparius]UWZ81715.1 helix-turn-helix domain-containing protein [Occallatibacter riparius]
MHVVLYLPDAFYSAIASTLVETLQAVNEVRGSEVFTYEFVSRTEHPRSKSGILYRANPRPSQTMDVLILLTGVTANALESVRELELETQRAKPLVLLAKRQKARIAATCGASYILANLGLLKGRCATISWWLKKEVKLRFPLVKWEPSRILVRDGSFYTTGAAFAGLELISSLLRDLGYSKEERLVRKLMVLPPARESQDPYEVPGLLETTSFEKRLRRIAHSNLSQLDISFLAKELHVTPRTLARRFVEELRISPGKWIQEQRLEAARSLLESTSLSVAEICYQVGYQDGASFGRLFLRVTGMTPGEYRRELRAPERSGAA